MRGKNFLSNAILAGVMLAGLGEMQTQAASATVFVRSSGCLPSSVSIYVHEMVDFWACFEKTGTS
jgi:hypothetical protein